MIWFAVVAVMVVIGAAAVKIMLVYWDALENVGPDDDCLPSPDTAQICLQEYSSAVAVSDTARGHAAGTN
jgi:hypothetical protein